MAHTESGRHNAHPASFRWRAPCPQQGLSLPGTRSQQEQIPPQRKFLGRLDVNNSRVRGWNTWRGAQQRQERLPVEGWLEWRGAARKGTSKIGTLGAPENLSVFISHTPIASLNQTKNKKLGL